MKTQTNTKLVIRSSLALAVALAIWSPVQARSAEPAEGKSMTDAKMIMSQCPMMKGIDEKSGDAPKGTEMIAECHDAPRGTVAAALWRLL